MKKYIFNPVICDACGEVINNANEGMVEWINDDGKIQDVCIVHHISFSPRNSVGCSKHRTNPLYEDAHLDRVLSDQALMDILGLVKQIYVANLMDIID